MSNHIGGFELVYLEIHFLQTLCQHHFTHLRLSFAKSLQLRQPHGCGYPLFQVFQLFLVQHFYLRLFCEEELPRQ